MKKNHNSKDSLIGLLMGLLVFLLIFFLVFYFKTPKLKKELYYFVIFQANGIALFITILSWILFIAFFALLFKRKSKFITSTVEEGDKEFLKQEELNRNQKTLLYLPITFTLLASLLAYFVFYYNFGGQWFYIDFLNEKKFTTLRLFLDFSNGFIPYILIFSYVCILFNILKIHYRIQKKYFSTDDIKDEFHNKSLPEPENYLNSNMPSFLLGARETKKSLDLEPDVKIPSYVYYRAPMTYGGLLIFGKKGSGKSSIIRRIIEDSIRYKSNLQKDKMSICVIDIKGDLADFIEKKAKENSRESDVIRLGVSTFAKWCVFR